MRAHRCWTCAVFSRLQTFTVCGWFLHRHLDKAYARACAVPVRPPYLKTVHSFTCPRCGRVSHSFFDEQAGYCGHCRDWTGSYEALTAMSREEYMRYLDLQRWGGNPSPRRVRRLGRTRGEHSSPELPHRIEGGPAWNEAGLTPAVVLEHPGWVYEGTEDDGSTTVWRFDPLAHPWVSVWRPDTSMGPMTVTWENETLRLRVSTEVMARAVMELVHPPYLIGPHAAWSWDELRTLHEMTRYAGPARRLREAAAAAATPEEFRAAAAAIEIPEPGQHRLTAEGTGTWGEVTASRIDIFEAEPPHRYRCSRCDAEYDVPPGHPGPVLCGNHCPPEYMAQVTGTPPAQAATAAYLRLREAGLPSAQAEVIAGLHRVTENALDALAQVLPEVTAAELYRAWRGAGVEAAGQATEDQFAELFRLLSTGHVSPQDARDTLGNEIRPALAGSRPPSWIEDAIAVWDGCKDQARRERSLAELAQQIADATPHEPPSERGTDHDTAMRHHPDDPGDIFL